MKNLDSSQKILFIDLDGTLWEHETLDVPAADAVRKAQQAGNLVYLCTGRSAGQLPAPVLAAINFDGMITNGGGTARIGDKVIVEKVMAPAQVSYLTQLFQAEDIPYLLETDGGVFGSPDMIDLINVFVRNVRRTKAAALLESQADIEPAEPESALTELADIGPASEARLDHVAKVVFCSEDSATYDRVAALIGNDFYIVPSSIPMPGGSSGEIAPLGVSKGTAIAAVLDALGLSKDQAIGIGDSHNDLEMFAACGTAVAMGNAVPELLAQADYVTAAVLDGGVSEALTKLGVIA